MGGGSKNYLQTPATHQSFYEDIVMKSCYLAIVKTQLLLTGDHFSALGLYILGCLGSKHSFLDSLMIGAEGSINFIEVHGRAGR